MPEESFKPDLNDEQVKSHNQEVKAVMDAYLADKPVRVPIFCGDSFVSHGFYAQEIGLDYREYYNDPDVMARVQLGAAKRRRELPLYDLQMATLPDHWSITVDQWPAVWPGWFGCETLYRKDSVIAHHGLNLGKKECDALKMPNPLYGGILDKMYRYYTHLKDTYEGDFRFMGRPVKIKPGVGTAGLFSSALDIRGIEIMVDMYEDPDFVHRFLDKLAVWIDTLCATWDRVAGVASAPFTITDHGIDMLSAANYEEFIVPVLLKMNKGHMDVPRQLHHCGRGPHLFPVMQRYFKIDAINALTYPLLDIAKVRAQVGQDVWIDAFIDDAYINLGKPETVRQTVKDLMASGAKGAGRFRIMVGDMLKGTSLENMAVMYEAVKEFGRY